jgi:glycosyltransferase involved in cell wall biosynthesis
MRYIFYSSVKNLSDFTVQRFYANDIYCLQLCGNTVHVTNKISDFLYFWKYDCAFIYFFRKGFFAGLIAKILLKKVYFTGGIDDLNLNNNSNKYLIQKYLFILSYLISNFIFIVSRSDMRVVNNLTRKDKLKRLVYSPHSVLSDLELIQLFSKPPKKEPHLFTTICWMSSVGNVKRKGVDKSLNLFKKYLSIYPDSKYIIIGRTGDGSDYLIKLANDIGISESVVFTGIISEEKKNSILDMSTYYFQISRYEGFGLAALEALYHLNLVIHTAQGGLFDTIDNYGFIVTEDDMLNINSFDINSIISNSFSFGKVCLSSLKDHLSQFTHSARCRKFNGFK